MNRIWALLFLLNVGFSSFSQNDSALSLKCKPNVVKWNPTPMIWSGKNINLSYERVIKPNQSFSINAGYFVLPTSGIYDSLKFNISRNNWGFAFSADYRFYFKKRNTRNAPDGLYWSPYTSIHHTGFENRIEIRDENIGQGNIDLNARLSIYSAGVQLGYQFVIKERFTIDLIFIGPSLTVYSATLRFTGDLNINEENEYYQAVKDMLLSKFPFLSDLVSDQQFSSSGVSTSMGFGFRYVLQLGYRF